MKNEIIPIQELIRNTRQAHHIGLNGATYGSKSELSRYETGKSELATDVLQDIFERIGLSFFDIRVQTNDFTPLWQQTVNQLHNCIGRNDSEAAAQVLAEYRQDPAATSSPMAPLYDILFKCMLQQTNPDDLITPELGHDQQEQVLQLLTNGKNWQMFEFTLFQYAQWYLSPARAEHAFGLMLHACPTDRLRDANYLYRLPFADATVAYLQHALISGMDVSVATRRLEKLTLIMHMNVERTARIHLVRQVASRITGTPAVTPSPEKLLNITRDIGLNAQYHRLRSWLDQCVAAQEVRS
jgi:hypothetical protein